MQSVPCDTRAAAIGMLVASIEQDRGAVRGWALASPDSRDKETWRKRWRPYRRLAVSYLFASEFEKGT